MQVTINSSSTSKALQDMEYITVSFRRLASLCFRLFPLEGQTAYERKSSELWVLPTALEMLVPCGRVYAAECGTKKHCSSSLYSAVIPTHCFSHFLSLLIALSFPLFLTVCLSLSGSSHSFSIDPRKVISFLWSERSRLDNARSRRSVREPQRPPLHPSTDRSLPDSCHGNGDSCHGECREYASRSVMVGRRTRGVDGGSACWDLDDEGSLGSLC